MSDGRCDAVQPGITPYPDIGKFGAYASAFDRWTEGHSVEEALDMARDLIGICIGFAREDGTELAVETVAPLLTAVSVADPAETVNWLARGDATGR